LRKLGGSAFLFLAFTLAGTSVISARLVSDGLGPFLVTAVSLLFALAFLLPFCARSLAALRRLPLRGWLNLVLQALFGIFLFRLFLLWGLKWTSAGEAGILTGATPAVTALLAVLILKERLSAGKLAGIGCTVAGILLLQGLLSGGFPTARHLGGNLLVLCAAVSEGVFNVLSRVFALSATETEKQLKPATQTAAVIALALLFSLVPALFEHPMRGLSAAGPTEWLALAWYGGVVTALGYFFWYAGINRSGAFAAAAFSGMMPLTSMLLSVIILGEPAGWAQWAGGALVAAGMILIGASASGGTRKIRRSLDTRKAEEQ
jgi:drug/metabolite transporter (DMT)-like permease